jgi:glutaconate CoA-transferase subunit A
MSIEDAVAGIPDGASVAIGGATLRRKPMALVRALIAAGRRDLTVWTWIGSLDVDLLIAAGAVRCVNSAYLGLGPLGLAPVSRQAFAAGTVEFVDWSESSLVGAFRAGSQGLPFSISRALVGSSLAEGLGVEVPSPFGGPPVHALPAARADFALIHAQLADAAGNVGRPGPNLTDDVDHVIAASADRVIVTVERLVSREETRDRRDETVIPGHLVSAVCLAEQGAHPTGCDGFYNPDIEHLRGYLAAAMDPERLGVYLREHAVPLSRYLELVGSPR